MADVFGATEADFGARLDGVSADGGASSNPFLMQAQADVLDRPVEVPEAEEVGALGAPAMAFTTLGVTLPPLRRETRFDPTADPKRIARLKHGWRGA